MDPSIRYFLMGLLLLSPFFGAPTANGAQVEVNSVQAAAAAVFEFTAKPVSAEAGYQVSFTVGTFDGEGNATNDHNGFSDIISISGPPGGVDGASLPIDFADGKTHTFDICFRLPGTYTLTVDASEMTSDTHTIVVSESVVSPGLAAGDSVTYMDDYSRIIMATDPRGDFSDFTYSITGQPPGLSISLSLIHI